MVKKLQKIGNSFCVILDKAILKLIKVENESKTSFEIEIKNGNIILKPIEDKE